MGGVGSRGPCRGSAKARQLPRFDSITQITPVMPFGVHGRSARPLDPLALPFAPGTVCLRWGGSRRRRVELRGLELGAPRLPLSHECGVKGCVGLAASEAAKRSEQSEWLFDRLVAGETAKGPPGTLALGRVRSRPVSHVFDVEVFFGCRTGPSARVISTFGSACLLPSPAPVRLA